MWQAVTWTFTFLIGILLSLVNLVIFSLLGGTSSILRTFLGGTSEKNHPVPYHAASNTIVIIAITFSATEIPINDIPTDQHLLHRLPSTSSAHFSFSRSLGRSTTARWVFPNVNFFSCTECTIQSLH